MKILFLTLSRGVADINARGIYSDLLRCFRKQGHDIYAAYPFERRLNKETCLSDSDGFHSLGIKTLNITKTNVIEKGIGTLLLETQYNKAIRHFWGGVKFDLVMYSTPPITFNKVIENVKKKCGAKSYLLLKDIFPQNAIDIGLMSKKSSLYRMFRKKEERLYAISDYIGCMSPANVEYVIANNPSVQRNKVEVCPNSIELTELASVSASEKEEVKGKYGIPTKIPLLIYGGNLGKPQGIDFLIKVLDSNANRKDVFFCVVGSGTESHRIHQWYSEAKPSNVLVMEAMPKNDYDRLVRTVDVGMIFLDRRFTIPNFPSRLLSYLECKMPVLLATDVNTDMGRIAEENGFGLWAESGDLEAFNSKLEKMLEPSVRSEMGEKGYKYLVENYLVEDTVNKILKHFE